MESTVWVLWSSTWWNISLKRRVNVPLGTCPHSFAPSNDRKWLQVGKTSNFSSKTVCLFLKNLPHLIKWFFWKLFIYLLVFWPRHTSQSSSTALSVQPDKNSLSDQVMDVVITSFPCASNESTKPTDSLHNFKLKPICILFSPLSGTWLIQKIWPWSITGFGYKNVKLALLFSSGWADISYSPLNS